MGFAEKRRRRAGNFGEVNDFRGRDFQINTKPSQRLIAGNGNKNSGYNEFINNYSDVLEGINRCGFRNDYFNYSIIDDIVSQYVSGDITKEQFIKEVQSKTQIYLDE